MVKMTAYSNSVNWPTPPLSLCQGVGMLQPKCLSDCYTASETHSPLSAVGTGGGGGIWQFLQLSSKFPHFTLELARCAEAFHVYNQVQHYKDLSG